MIIQTVQADLQWENPAANLAHFDELLDSSRQKADIIILPEMFSTGFTMNPRNVAEHAESSIEWMQGKAKEKEAVICGSLVVGSAGKYYNRLIWMSPQGMVGYYDKKHLFGLAGEDKPYTAGQKIEIFEYKGWKICPLICYDLRFPVWSRNTQGYDLLIYVANWPVARVEAWKSLLIARAIENQAYTIGVNDHTYSGDSCVVDYSGQVIYRATGIEQVGSVQLDYEAQQNFRKKLPYLQDRDTFEIK